MPYNRCGLICSNEWESPKIDLEKVEIYCSITNLTSNVRTTCTYKSNVDESVEAVYVFPLNNVALFSFEAKIEDRTIVAECRPRAEAKTTFDDAVASGHSAYLGEQDEGCEDVFQMRLGNVPGRSTVTIVLKYVGMLEAENLDNQEAHSRCIFTLPSVLNPRYTPNESKIDREFDPIGQCQSLKPYSITFSGDVNVPYRIVEVSSAHDKFDIEWISNDHTCAKIKMRSEFKADHDLQMLVYLDQKLKSFGVCESGDRKVKGILSKNCVMAQFMPDFSEFVDEMETRTELYFVIDRSGSMSGSNIQRASETLLLFLKSIPAGCRFQIIGFGSTYEALFPEPVEYNAMNVERAIEYQKHLEADLGGTEVYPALKEAFKSPLTGGGWYKQIIFFTDGDVGNADEVIGLVRSNVGQACIFPIGIGTGASTYLINGIARAGRGVATFIREPEEMLAASMKILNAALQPRASNIKVHWNLTSVDSSGRSTPLNVTVIPKTLPPVFNQCFATVYGLFDVDHASSVSGQVTLECEVMNKKQTFQLDLSGLLSERLLSTNMDLPLHRLAGKMQMDEISDEYKAVQTAELHEEEQENARQKDLRKMIEQLSCALNVISPFTAFIGVDPVKREPTKLPRNEPSYNAHFAACGAPPAMFMACDVPDCGLAAFEECLEYDADMTQESVGMSLPSPDATLKKAPERDSFIRLVSLQQIEGFWALSDDLAGCLDRSLAVIQSTKPKSWDVVSTKWPVSDEAWATALALAFCETVLSARASEWTLLARKAKMWLKKQAANTTGNVGNGEKLCDALISEAKKVFQSPQA